MATDLYVGSLSRYLAGDWQTENQKLFAQAGAPDVVQILRLDGWEPLAPDAALRSASKWRDEAIAAEVNAESELDGPIASWQEALDSPYEVKRLSPGGIAAVALSLFYDDPLKMPESLPDPLVSDPRVAAQQDDVTIGVASICLRADVWVPGTFLLVKERDWPRSTDGSQVRVGSLGFLRTILEEIKDRRWPHLPEALHAFAARSTAFPTKRRRGIWPFRREVEEEVDSTLLLAIQTLDRMKAMTAIALERNQPMILDR